MSEHSRPTEAPIPQPHPVPAPRPRRLPVTQQQPTEAERVQALQQQAAADRATYQATRTHGAERGNLTRGQQHGGAR